MKIISDAFKNGERIPQKYTCEGDGISPPFTFEDVPEDTISLVFIMDDPDVPISIRHDGIWDHLIVWNITPQVRIIKEGQKIEGVHGITTSGTLEYVPPCPPDREHRYFFKLYALDKKLSLEEGATKKDIESAMEGHIIENAILIGLYCKNNVK